MAFQCEGRRYERRFVKHQRTDDLPKSVLTVDSHCQSTCKLCVQCQSSISCGAELLTATHLICASKRFFGCQIHVVKPHVFAVSRTDLLSSCEPNLYCYPECHLRKGAQKEHFFLQ